jgi:hypothetical protein
MEARAGNRSGVKAVFFLPVLERGNAFGDCTRMGLGMGKKRVAEDVTHL